jgi:predicted RNA-binding protein with PUA-like domain
MRHWLIKSEPDVFSISDLERVKCEPWTGVRNYQARNFMMKEMVPGDLALFYHSNAKPPGVVGIARVAGEARPDPTQFNPADDYFDPKSNPDKPRWWMVDFEHVATFRAIIPLETIKDDPILKDMVVSQKGTRLSITPVDERHFQKLCAMAGWKG